MLKCDLLLIKVEKSALNTGLSFILSLNYCFIIFISSLFGLTMCLRLFYDIKLADPLMILFWLSNSILNLIYFNLYFTLVISLRKPIISFVFHSIIIIIHFGRFIQLLSFKKLNRFPQKYIKVENKNPVIFWQKWYDVLKQTFHLLWRQKILSFQS